MRVATPAAGNDGCKRLPLAGPSAGSRAGVRPRCQLWITYDTALIISHACTKCSIQISIISMHTTLGTRTQSNKLLSKSNIVKIRETPPLSNKRRLGLYKKS